MRPFKILFLLFLLISLTAYAQQLTCIDFKEGSFYVPADEEMPLSYKIIRKGTEQIEVVDDPNNMLGPDFNKTAYVKIEWIDACTSRLKYDETKMELSDYQKHINENNGFLTEMVKIEGNCFYFKSTFNDHDRVEEMTGKICKE
ncbi:hypothetical protein [Gelidibacter pelagius]|uniref:Uncharacterized protein n=1 Tax=Gelidibacter pelagius TaxID=2819985 RepID=A0ABS3SX44_9FLAO|nr:hypothetical protein [Gelidibacter pelagius]MBO3100021.1 hypothetical protein [Gelidibacter pelagius]